MRILSGGCMSMKMRKTVLEPMEVNYNRARPIVISVPVVVMHDEPLDAVSIPDRLNYRG